MKQGGMVPEHAGGAQARGGVARCMRGSGEGAGYVASAGVES